MALASPEEDPEEQLTVPFRENITVMCSETGKPLRNTRTAGFRQCVYDPRPGQHGTRQSTGRVGDRVARKNFSQ